VRWVRRLEAVAHPKESDQLEPLRYDERRVQASRDVFKLGDPAADTMMLFPRGILISEMPNNGDWKEGRLMRGFYIYIVPWYLSPASGNARLCLGHVSWPRTVDKMSRQHQRGLWRLRLLWAVAALWSCTAVRGKRSSKQELGSQYQSPRFGEFNGRENDYRASGWYGHHATRTNCQCSYRCAEIAVRKDERGAKRRASPPWTPRSE
jgi:hypothetical protein